jgi:purine-nucleoside phosphorylase
VLSLPLPGIGIALVSEKPGTSSRQHLCDIFHVPRLVHVGTAAGVRRECGMNEVAIVRCGSKKEENHCADTHGCA